MAYYIPNKTHLKALIAVSEPWESNGKCHFNYKKPLSQCLGEIISDYTCSRDEAKELVLRLMHGGTVEAWAKDHGKKPKAKAGCKFAQDLQLDTQALRAIVAVNRPEL